MQYNKKYSVKNNEGFEMSNFPLVIEEVQIINEKTKLSPTFFKPEIIVSFLKNHSLNTEWIKKNPELIALVVSGELFTGTIESLFESCRDNPFFKKGLEACLMDKFNVDGKS